MAADWSEPSGQDGTGDGASTLTQLVLDRAGALASATLEAVAERPALGLGALALAGGLIVGLWYGRRRKRPKRAARQVEDNAEESSEAAEELVRLGKRGRHAAEPARKAGKRASKVTLKDVAALVPLALKLLENPLVRGALVTALSRSAAKRMKG
ncbi:MAG: hypothetical protein IT307_01675 [Chloroflexi bacterium]|nr:hypothetical protein [Chloroflexota bacterium]